MAGLRLPGYPGGTDTDFEGKVHLLNEGEPYWIDRTVPRAKVVLDGRIAGKEWEELYSVPNLTNLPEAGLKAKLYAAWDEQNYYFAIKSNRPVMPGLTSMRPTTAGSMAGTTCVSRFGLPWPAESWKRTAPSGTFSITA